MRVAAWSRFRILVAGAAVAASGPALAQAPAVAVSPHPAATAGPVMQFQQVNTSPYRVGPGGVGVGATASVPGVTLSPVARPYFVGSGAGGGNQPARPNANNRMVFNPPVVNAFRLVPRPSTVVANPVVLHAVFNPWSLNPALVNPLPGAFPLLAANGVVQVGEFGPPVSPWAAAAYRRPVVWAYPVLEGSASERSPGSTVASSPATEPVENDVYYDPSSRTFVSPRPGGIVRPGTPGFLPWIPN